MGTNPVTRLSLLWPCVVALPLGWYVYLAVPDQAAVINLPTLCFTVGALLFLFLPGPTPQPRGR